MKRSNFTFLFLFALLSFVSTQSFGQANCIGAVNASVAPGESGLCSADLSGFATGSVAGVPSPAVSVRVGATTIAASGSGSVSFGIGMNQLPSSVIGTTQIVEVTFDNGTACWGEITFEAKTPPADGTGSIDTVCCGEDLVFPALAFDFDAQDPCFAQVDESTLQSVTLSTGGGICDTLIHVRTHTASALSGDAGNKNVITLQSDTLVEIPLDFAEVQFPQAEVDVPCAADGSDLDLSPSGLISILTANGVPMAPTLATPYLLKGTTTTITFDTTIVIIETMVPRRVFIDGVWVEVTEIVKTPDTTIVEVPVTTPDVILLKTNGESNQTTCNLNAKCEDWVTDGPCGLPVVMRTWTVTNWCDAKTSVADSVQWINVTPPAPSFTLSGPSAPSIEPWVCTASATVVMTRAASCVSPANAPASWTTSHGSISVGMGMVTVSGLEAGVTATVTATVTNDCDGASATQTFMLTPVDNVSPVAIAEDQINVTLTPDGTAKVPYQAIDGGSNDQNCGDVTICVFRTDDETIEDCSDAVIVTCDDDLVSVTIVVTDGAGNSAQAWGNVNVEEKFADVVCPGDLVLDCFDNIALPDAFVVTGCNQITLVPSTPVGPDNCGFGMETIEYRLPAEFADEFPQFADRVLCDIDITYTGGGEPFDGDIDFPGDVTLDCGDVIPAAELDLDDLKCNLVAWSSEDSDFLQDDQACGKVIRNFTVIDWCAFEQFDGVLADAGESDGVFRHEQVISIFDNDAPMFGESTVVVDLTGNTNKPGEGDFTGCTADVTISVEVSDLCNGVSFDGVSTGWEFGDLTGSGTSATIEDLAVGDYSITFHATDRCGNTTSQAFAFAVVDDKSPTPVCIQFIATATMDESGESVIWASDFNFGSFDNCDPNPVVEFRDADGNGTPSLTFTCADVANGVAAPVAIDLYVVDASGNEDFCTVTLSIQDNDADACDDVDTGAAISGSISTELGDMIESARVTLNNALVDLTSVQGQYAFRSNPEFTDYTITTERNDDFLNGVTTLDLVLIQQHVLGISALDSPFKIIAADINSDARVTAIDLVELRKLILGVYTELPQNDSWRFVDATQTFADATRPFPFSESLDVANLVGDVTGQDFLGVKIGDVSGSAIANSLIAAGTRSAGLLELEIADAAITAGEEVSVAVTAANFSDIAAYQFTMDVNGLEFTGVESGAIAVNAENFGLLDGNTITTAWNSTAGVNANDVLFTMNFRATASGTLSESIGISSRVTPAAAYTSTAAEMGISVSFSGVATSEFALFQNEPNPFDNVTRIAFELPSASSATLTVFDVTGKVVSLVRGDFAQGANTITLDKSDLNASGVLYYQLESGEFTATKKMIVIE